MEIISRIGYKDIFGKENDNFNSLINKIDILESLKIMTGLIKKENELDELFGSEISFIYNYWLKESSPKFVETVTKGYKKMILKSKLDIKDIKLINRLASLRLIEIFQAELFNKENISKKNNSEESLFKIYLLVNDEISEIQEKAFSPFRPIKTNIYNSPRFNLLLGLTQELVNTPNPRILLTSGVLKFIQFEKWLRDFEKYKVISELYLKKMGLTSWYEYFSDVFQINNLSIDASIILTKQTIHLTSLLDYFSIQNHHSIKNYEWDNLMSLRKNPVLKLEKGNYLILDFHFMLDKFFSSVYHDFIKISKELNITTFNQDFSKHFLEEFLLKNTFKGVFGKSYIKFSELEIKEKSKKNLSELGLPDYYIRNGNKILLFECKNSFISNNSKLNLNLNILEKEIKEKFYIHKKRSKAIKQLINYILNIHTGKYSFFDPTLKSKKLRYYPIIITNDNTLNSLGINKLLNEYLDIERNKIDSILLGKIKNVTIIHIDDLLCFSSKLKKLDQIIDKYHNYINRKNLDHMLSFSHYLNLKESPIGEAQMIKADIGHILKNSLLPSE